MTGHAADAYLRFVVCVNADCSVIRKVPFRIWSGLSRVDVHCLRLQRLIRIAVQTDSDFGGLFNAALGVFHVSHGDGERWVVGVVDVGTLVGVPEVVKLLVRGKAVVRNGCAQEAAFLVGIEGRGDVARLREPALVDAYADVLHGVEARPLRLGFPRRHGGHALVLVPARLAATLIVGEISTHPRRRLLLFEVDARASRLLEPESSEDGSGSLRGRSRPRSRWGPTAAHITAGALAAGPGRLRVGGISLRAILEN